jgi:hypothetical protein
MAVRGDSLFARAFRQIRVVDLADLVKHVPGYIVKNVRIQKA